MLNFEAIATGQAGCDEWAPAERAMGWFAAQCPVSRHGSKQCEQRAVRAPKTGLPAQEPAGAVRHDLPRGGAESLHRRALYRRAARAVDRAGGRDVDRRRTVRLALFEGCIVEARHRSWVSGGGWRVDLVRSTG
jgi:hypothetical protein